MLGIGIRVSFREVSARAGRALFTAANLATNIPDDIMIMKISVVKSTCLPLILLLGGALVEGL